MCVGGVVRGCCCSKRALPSRFCCFPIQVKCIMKPFIWSTPGINFVHTVCSGLYPYILPTANCRTGHHACSGSGCGKFLNCKPSLKTVSSAEASCGHPLAHFFLYEHRRREEHFMWDRGGTRSSHTLCICLVCLRIKSCAWVDPPPPPPQSIQLVNHCLH